MISIQEIKDGIEEIIKTAGYPKEFLDTYDQIECLASTNGRETFLVKNKKDGAFAIAKCFDKKNYSFNLDIELLKNLNHPGIPKFLNSYESDEVLCVVRDYVDGIALDEYVNDSNLNEEEKINISVKLADILIYLHGQAKPIIHRDIKPANVIIKENGEVALIDFDIARTVKEDSETDTAFFGTKGYAPPEQYGFEQTSQKADIYAFGVLMRFLFTGDVHQKNKVELNPKIQYVIDNCTAFSPKDRYADMKHVKEDLIGKKTSNKKKIIFTLALTLIAVCACLFINFNKSPKVVFKEPLIEEAVRLQLNYDEDDIIREDDLLKVEELYIFGTEAFKNSNELYKHNQRNSIRGKLNSLEDLKYLPNLQQVAIGYQKELDINGIENAKYLHSIDLKHVDIIDLSPIAELNNLDSVFLFNSGIDECKVLESLPNLEHLDVGYTDINSIAKIGEYHTLKELSIKMLNMYNLDGIEKMPSIEVLWLNDAGIADISAIKNLNNLKVIHTDQKYVETINKLFEGRDIEIIVEGSE